jgi:hypothetical protein
MTGIVADAYRLRRQCREEFELYLEAQFEMASEACRGRLLTGDAFRAGINARSLFMGSADRANLHASDELAEWWRAHRRLNYRQFEEQWVRNTQEVPI